MFNRIRDFLDRANDAFRNIGIIYGKMDYIYSELHFMKDILAPFDQLAKDEMDKRNRKKVILAVSYRNGKVDHKWYSYQELSKWLGDRYQEPLVYLSNASPGEVVYIDGMLATWVETSQVQRESRHFQLT